MAEPGLMIAGQAAPLLPAGVQALAILSDIHGNLQALEAALADVAAQRVDAVVCNGDLITGSAHSRAVAARLRELGIPCTRGNHERYLSELADPADPKWQGANWAPIRHEWQALPAGQRAWLAALPDTLWLCDGPAALVMAHAAPGNDTARLTAQTGDGDWAGHFAGLPTGATLVGSHLHWFWQRAWQGFQFVRTPSVGLPLDGDRRAGYVVLRRRNQGWQVQVRRVAYDLDAELAAFRQSEYYAQGGVIAHLFWEELRTARWWIVPFFAHLRRVSTEIAAVPLAGGLSANALEAALRTFDRSQVREYAPDGEQSLPLTATAQSIPVWVI